ncbi:unnamed protein product [Laminaria digitata]
MCIVTRVAAMFHCTSSCTAQLFSDPVMDFDDEPPPMSSPKLTRCDETSPTSAAPARALSASTSTGEIGLGMEPALPTLDLKPRDFRRKDPALHFLAGIRGDTEELESWLLAGGDPNARDGEGWALLHHASMNGRVECVQLLLRHGARHDLASAAGHSVLHVASANRHCAVVESLVEAGAFTDAQNAHGNTPLHSAAATGTVDVVLYLLSNSADPDAVNSEGETADRVHGAGPEAFLLLQEARQRKQARVAQRLALVKIHKLWNSGRAGPRSDSLATADRPAAAEGGAGADAAAEVEAGASSADEAKSYDTAYPQSLDSAVASVADLPQEVLRRLVSYCTL